MRNNVQLGWRFRSPPLQAQELTGPLQWGYLRAASKRTARLTSRIKPVNALPHSIARYVASTLLTEAYQALLKDR